MRRMITTALAVASLLATATPGAAGVAGMVKVDAAPSMVEKTMMQDRDHHDRGERERDWERDHRCHDWDRDRRACRDRDEGCRTWDPRSRDCRDWDRDRWRGIESCRRAGHDRYLNRRNHWERCPRRDRGGY